MSTKQPDPLTELSELQERMNTLFRDIVSRTLGAADPEADEGSDWSPRVDLFEEAERFVLKADLPGLSSNDYQLQIDNGKLHLSGERSIDRDMPRESHLRIERQYGRFSVKIALPPSVDRQEIKANHNNGVLEVILPKRQDSGSGTIRVEVD